jgi:oligoendopeptidase F
MSNNAVVDRKSIPEKYKWNARAMFASDTAWEAEAAALLKDVEKAASYRNRLMASAAVLCEALEFNDAILRRLSTLHVYAGMSHSVDIADPAGTKLHSKAQSVIAAVLAALSFVEPELLAIGEKQVYAWMQENPRLAVYRHYAEQLFRRQAHVRSPEVEELLGMLAESFSGPRTIWGMLTDADLKFEPAQTERNTALEFNSGTLGKILSDKDRVARRTAYEHYQDEFLAHKNTFAAALCASVKQNVFEMRARRHKSTLEMSLFDNNIPVEVFHNLIATFRKNLPTWHRYWKVRAKALGLEKLHAYDVHATIAETTPAVSYEQAVEWICAGMAPLGDEYVSAMRKGCLQDGWVDVYPNKGKRAGAFSSGSQGCPPYIMMSYNDNLMGMSTLAHELGHSMHKYYCTAAQPFVYSRYTLFAAEVASNFNQAMTRAYLFKTQSEKSFQIALIEEAMANFHRYFFVMPTLARFELEVHQRLERGQALTADDMINLMADLHAEGFGDGVVLDRERDGISWATFTHLYSDYYVYQYATGISGAHALSALVLSGKSGASEDYLKFLKCGGSCDDLDALKIGGVDLASPQPAEQTYQVLADLVTRLEGLVSHKA